MSVHPRVVLSVAQRLSQGDDAPSAHAEILQIVWRVKRYLARRRGAEAARSGLVGGASAALQTRIARTIARLPRSMRPEAVRLAAALRATISNARSAGDHALLAEKAARLLKIETAEPMRWLDLASAEMATSFADRAPTRKSRPTWRVDAILIGT